MKNTIHKINELFLSESFLQVNLVKGFKYVDKVGEIINQFHSDNKTPHYVMTINQLNIQKSVKEEIKVSPYAFWEHFIEPDTLDQCADAFSRNTQDVLNILNVSELSRIGWRNYFIYEFLEENGDKKRDIVLAKFLSQDGLNFENIQFSCQLDKIDFNFRIKKVFKDDPNKTPCLLLDIDCFQNFSKFLPAQQIKSALRRMREKIQSEDFLEIINYILHTPNDK